MANGKIPLLGVAGLLFSVVALTARAADPPAATTAAQSPAASVGLFVYAAKEQDAAQQSKDESECYDWSKTQSGVDPTAPAPASAPAAEATDQGAGGERVRGAARGAAAGAVIGEVADDDASEGAKVGAAAGVVAGGHQARKNRRDQQEKAEQTTAANADAATAAQQQQLDTFKRGMGACLEGRGYTVK